MKKMSLICLMAVGLLLTPCLAQATGIDPENSIEVTSDNTIGISEDSGGDTSIITSEDGDGGIPVVASIDPPAPVDPPPDPRPDDPPINDPPPSPPPVPLPSTIILVGSGLLGLGFLGRRRRKQR